MTNSEFRLADAWLRVIQNSAGGKFSPEGEDILRILSSEREFSLRERLDLVINSDPFTETAGPRNQDFMSIVKLHEVILPFCGSQEAHWWLNRVCEKMKTTRVANVTPAFTAGSFLALLEFGVSLDQSPKEHYSEFQENLLMKLFEVIRIMRYFHGNEILQNRRFLSRFNSAVGRYVLPEFVERERKEKRKTELAKAIRHLGGWDIIDLRMNHFSRLFLRRVAHGAVEQIDILFGLPTLSDLLAPNLAIEFNEVKEEGDARQPTDPEDDLSILKADGEGEYPTSTA